VALQVRSGEVLFAVDLGRARSLPHALAVRALEVGLISGLLVGNIESFRHM
jgi:hypothetical protein